MAAGRSLDTLVRAARLYYEDGLSQGEVARRLGLSPSAVTRLVAGLEDRLGLRLQQRWIHLGRAAAARRDRTATSPSRSLARAPARA